jgi:hypothetical protein
VADPVAAIENFLTTDPAIPDGRADQPIDNEAILISPAYRDRPAHRDPVLTPRACCGARPLAITSTATDECS